MQPTLTPFNYDALIQKSIRTPSYEDQARIIHDLIGNGNPSYGSAGLSGKPGSAGTSGANGTSFSSFVSF